MKYVILSLTCLVVSLSSSVAPAAQVTWGAAQSNGIGDAFGTPLPNGSNDLILLGHFNLTNAQITANATNEAFLMANFVQFASTTIGNGNPNGAGSASDGYWLTTSINSSNALAVNNTEMYYWVFNSPTAVAASQYGIFTNAALASWKFPDDTAIPPTTTTDLADVPQNSQGILVGSFGLGLSKDGTSPLFNLAVIPEPSTYAFAGIAVAALAARHLRKSRRS